jgi:hypothetical protein
MGKDSGQQSSGRKRSHVRRAAYKGLRVHGRNKKVVGGKCLGRGALSREAGEAQRYQCSKRIRGDLAG